MKNCNQQKRVISSFFFFFEKKTAPVGPEIKVLISYDMKYS